MGYYPQESLYKPYKYHGYTVRGTPNCPLTFPFLKTLRKTLRCNSPRRVWDLSDGIRQSEDTCGGCPDQAGDRVKDLKGRRVVDGISLLENL